MANNHGQASAGSVALAFLSGALLGYARRTGEDLRDFSERTTGTVEEMVGRGRELVDEISCAVREAIDAGRDAMRREREMNSLD